jgi:hypothetical protein
MSTLLILIIGFLFSIISVKYFFIPYILIAIFWLSLFIILTLASKATVKKSIWFNLAFLAFLLGVLEVYSYFSLNAQKNKSNSRIEGEYKNHGYMAANDILGYAPPGDRKFTSKKFYQNQLLYDVTYTIGKDGLRITPPAESHSDNECVIFFGGSYTFGEGVDDRSAMPYIVGTLQSYKVYNFGFHGYGPHQMLSAIENGMIDCKPELVIYQVLTTHIARSAGYSSWDQHGPRYVLRNKRLIYNGHFDDQGEASFSINERILFQLEKSNFYRKFIIKVDKYTITDHDIQLFLEIVDDSRSKLVKKFPEVEFHVILWDKSPDDLTYLKVRDGFNQKSIQFHLVSDMLPGYSEDKTKYEIIYDRHPNTIAYQLIAEYVVKNIINGMNNPRTPD